MKKRLWIVAVIAIAMMLVLTACGGEEGSGDSGSGEESKAAEEKPVKLAGKGYTVDDDHYLHYAFIIKNPDENNAYEFPAVTITAYDGNGDVLATEEQMMMQIQPGEKQSFASLIDCNGETPDKVTFEVDTGTKIKASDDAVKASDFKISGENERPGDYGDLSVTGKVKNTSEKDCDSVAVVVVFKKGKKIVYGDLTYIDGLSAGKEKPFEISMYNVPDHDSFTVTAHNWGI